MSDNALRACFLGLCGVTVVTLASLVALGHDSAVTDSLLAVCGGVTALTIWERLRRS